jgi:DNA processing protein
MNGPGHPSSCPDPQAVRLTRGDGRYPRTLDDLQENAPALLWALGRTDLLAREPAVAIVGTRRATGYGQRVARELGSAFARAGACVISGLATGIDGIAHRAALEAKGATIAVLGTGLGVHYPSAHRELQHRIAREGLLLTELDPGYPGMKHTFKHRNRIIAALASLTIVVEAPERSGALGTADHALTLGREVAAIPGPIDQPQSVGSNRLIRDGAVILTSVEEALTLAGLTPALRTPRVDPRGDAGRVWAALANGPLDMDSLCHGSGLPAAQCLAAVSQLEVAGAIECALTGQIRRR